MTQPRPHCINYDHCDGCGACRFKGHPPKVVDGHRCLCPDCYEKESR